MDESKIYHGKKIVTYESLHTVWLYLFVIMKETIQQYKEDQRSGIQGRE